MDNQAKREDEYRALLIDLYKENQSFLNKAIFTISSLAIPILMKGSAEYDVTIFCKSFLTLSLIGFFTVIVLQIYSLKYARDGCDHSLSEENKNEGFKLFKKARYLDIWRERAFLISFLFLAIALIFNIFTMEKKMTNKSKYLIEQTRSIQNSFVPPNSIIQQKSFVPPEAIVTEIQQSVSQETNQTTNIDTQKEK